MVWYSSAPASDAKHSENEAGMARWVTLGLSPEVSVDFRVSTGQFFNSDQPKGKRLICQNQAKVIGVMMIDDD